MKKPQMLMIPFLITSLLLGTATIAPAQISDENYTPVQATAQTIASAAAEPANTPATTSAPAQDSTGVVAKTAAATPSQVPSRPAAKPTPKPVASRGSSASSAPANQSKASGIIATAKRYMGVKYVWGGTTPQGFDCSGFSQYVFAKNGISLPRVSRDQYNVGRAVSFSNLQPGDLVFFALSGKGIDHLGIYVGGGQFINASTSKGVTIYPLSSYWKSHFVGARRVL